MNATSIEWTDLSVNPLRARNRKTGAVGHYCEMVSQGCANCYSSRFQPRFGLPLFGSGQHRDEVEPFLDAERLAQVLRRKKPGRIFWCDMTDLFGHWVNDAWINQCFAVMAITSHLTHQVLTKRADRMRDYLSDPDRPRQVAEWMAGNGMMQASYCGHVPSWPPHNIWTGFSAENQECFDRRAAQSAPLMRAGWLVWVSAEPLLGPITMQGNSAGLSRNWLGEVGIRWVVTGGESGPGARPIHPDWARSLRDQCQQASAGPFFFKQWGQWRECEKRGQTYAVSSTGRQKIVWPDGRTEDYRSNWKPDYAAAGAVLMESVGKSAAGRLLDGREWSEFPSVEVSR